MKKLIKKVEQWAEEKGIFEKSYPLKQHIKTQEEVNELLEAMANNNEEAVKDAIGDILVTLIIQAKMQNMQLKDCLKHAYNTISNRQGKMVNGIFVKEEQPSQWTKLDYFDESTWPPENTDVLVRDLSEMNVAYLSTNKVGGTQFFSTERDEPLPIQQTHWMPLPEPPKE